MTDADTAEDDDLRGLAWMGGIFLLVGLVLLTSSAWLFQRTAAFDAIAVETSGTVVNLTASKERRRDRDGAIRRSVHYRPVVEFIDSQGRKQTLESSHGSNPPAYKRGETVAILYDPDNPEFAVIDDWHRYFADMIVLGMGGIFSVVGLGILFTSLRQQKNTPKKSAQ